MRRCSATGKGAGAIIQEKGLTQVSDAGALEAFVVEAIARNPKSVADFKAGNAAALNFLKGQVMKLSKGKANPQLVRGDPDCGNCEAHESSKPFDRAALRS